MHFPPKFNKSYETNAFGFPKTTAVSGFSNSMFCFSAGDVSKQGFPVVPRQINETVEKQFPGETPTVGPA